jgi:heat shock protein HslJ
VRRASLPVTLPVTLPDRAGRTPEGCLPCAAAVMIGVNRGAAMVRLATSAVSAALVAGVLAGCATQGVGSAPDGDPIVWPGSRWRVEAIVDPAGARMTVPAEIPVDLAFDAAALRASGSAGCNRYSAGATADGTRIAFGPAAASKRMCPGPAMDVESAFLAALGRVTSARLDGDRLRMSGAEGTAVLDLVRAPD